MHIVLVGFGAVGYVLIQVLEEIAAKQGEKNKYSLLVRNDTISNELHALNIDANILIISDFMSFFKEKTNISNTIDRTINCASPVFNTSILQWCLDNKSNYMDLASLLHTDDVIAGQVQQQKFHNAFINAWLVGVINAGMSPGMTEILTGYVIKKYKITPTSYKLSLDENFNSLVPLFSRAPSVAVDEMMTPGFVMENGRIYSEEPFSLCSICSSKKCFNYYVITQEELVSMYHHYKSSLRSLQIVAGGAEVEHMKFLYNMGLFSQEPLCGTTLLEIIKSKMPKAATKEQIIDAFEKSLIDDAGFAFHIEMGDKNKIYKIQSIFDFTAFKNLKNTSYFGATSVSYPTGTSAGYIFWLAQLFKWKGIIWCLEIWLQAKEKDILDVIDRMNTKNIKTEIIIT